MLDYKPLSRTVRDTFASYGSPDSALLLTLDWCNFTWHSLHTAICFLFLLAISSSILLSLGFKSFRCLFPKGGGASPLGRDSLPLRDKREHARLSKVAIEILSVNRVLI